nr:class I SAM-dependent RNA methyltransferase [Bdellovibrio sp. HAGR004]
MPNFHDFETFDKDLKVKCPYAQDCGGCQLLERPYKDQIEGKKAELLQLLKGANIPLPADIKALSAGASHLRDRLDFSLQDGRLGLYRKDRHEVLDIEVCAQLSPELQSWLTDFRQIQWPFKKGSFRLRIAPHGRRGVWIDLANIDIKTLLDEQNILKKLQAQAFVEIGQRRKVPVWTGAEFKLRDPEHHTWFQSWVGEVPVDLYCQVASFTQPSHKANKLICDVIASWVQKAPSSRVIEFGSGIGNLTFPALSEADSLLACEIDDLSLQGLEHSLNQLPPSLAHLKNRVQIYRGDFQKKLTQDFSDFDLILANPPRSGLMNFLNPLKELSLPQRPEFFIYMSCFPESMTRDLVTLNECDYQIQELYILDQFPQTSHYEVLTLLQRKKA